MRMFLVQLLVIALLASGLCSGAAAQTTKPKVSDLEGLLAKPFGTRNLGMGWGGVADGTVAADIYYNPANMLALGGIEFSTETQNWAGAFDFFNSGGASRFQVGVGSTMTLDLSAGLWYAEQVDTFETKDRYLNMAVALGLGNERFQFGVGAAVKPVWLEFSSFDQDETVVAFDVGLYLGGHLFDTSSGTFSGSAGASVINAGSDAEADSVTSELPTEVRVGVSLAFKTDPTSTRAQSNASMLEVYLNAELITRTLQDETDTGSGPENPPVGSSIGFEVRLVNTFNLRMGWLDDGVGGKVRSETYGAGVQFGSDRFRFAVDLAHVPELFQDGPSVTATGMTIAWYF